jgi:hypothetical protein
MSCQGHLCEEHEICGNVLKEVMVVRLCKLQLMVEEKEETAITAIWVTDGVGCCCVGFVPCHMINYFPESIYIPSENQTFYKKIAR